MKFKPLTDEGKKTFMPLPEGRYAFAVVDAAEKVSKSGNDMIALKLDVKHEGSTRVIFDYLLPTSKKLRSFCQSVGLEDKYMLGEITDSDCYGKKGECQVVIEDSPEYGKQNKVIYYVSAKAGKEEAKKEEQWKEDDIPF